MKETAQTAWRYPSGRRAVALLCFLLIPTRTLPAAGESPRPIALHPDNPHYFLFRGKPTVLITSGEHYGAVLNLDFNYVAYLNELGARGFNLTRTFAGAYREIAGSFKIANNTLAPVARDRYICPWARTATPGAVDGGNKWDLNTWDDAYFKRLKDFVAQAGRRGVVVELVLFCTFYEDRLWDISPMNANNNVNNVGAVARTDAYALKEPALTAVQDALVRKIANELRDADNVYYEICNEPYFAGVTLEWQRHIAATIADAEASFPAPHLTAQNIANKGARVSDPNPAVSIFNFHYASPPDTVKQNYGLNKVIGFDESGFRGTADLPYRTEAWAFILAGGAVYSNLDYSYTAAHPDGTAKVVAPTPGGGGPTLRSQLAILKDFVAGFDFIHARPDASVVVGLPEGIKAYALAKPGEQYAIYLQGGKGPAEFELYVSRGRYQAEWVNTRTGKVDKAQTVVHGGGKLALTSPNYSEDIALWLAKREGRSWFRRMFAFFSGK
jgi:hypothetical protein